MHVPEGLYDPWRCTDRNEAGTKASNVLRVFGRNRRFVMIQLDGTLLTLTAISDVCTVSQRADKKMTASSSSRESSSSSPAADGIWDPDDYMHSYDSDDYDDATYIQLQSKRVLPRQQAPSMLFETSADRKKSKTSRIRKVSTVAGPDVHKLDS